jgi:hypothetical protein
LDRDRVDARVLRGVDQPAGAADVVVHINAVARGDARGQRIGQCPRRSNAQGDAVPEFPDGVYAGTHAEVVRVRQAEVLLANPAGALLKRRAHGPRVDVASRYDIRAIAWIVGVPLYVHVVVQNITVESAGPSVVVAESVLQQEPIDCREVDPLRVPTASHGQFGVDGDAAPNAHVRAKRQRRVGGVAVVVRDPEILHETGEAAVLDKDIVRLTRKRDSPDRMASVLLRYEFEVAYREITGGLCAVGLDAAPRSAEDLRARVVVARIVAVARDHRGERRGVPQVAIPAVVLRPTVATPEQQPVTTVRLEQPAGIVDRLYGRCRGAAVA